MKLSPADQALANKVALRLSPDRRAAFHHRLDVLVECHGQPLTTQQAEVVIRLAFAAALEA